MLRVPDFFKPNAFSITFYYLVFAMLWILLSDQFLVWLTNDAKLISQYQTVKGLFYVVITGIFLYYLIYLNNERISSEKERIDSALYAAGMANWSINLQTKKFNVLNITINSSVFPQIRSSGISINSMIPFIRKTGIT